MSYEPRSNSLTTTLLDVALILAALMTAVTAEVLLWGVFFISRRSLKVQKNQT